DLSANVLGPTLPPHAGVPEPAKLRVGDSQPAFDRSANDRSDPDSGSHDHRNQRYAHDQRFHRPILSSKEMYVEGLTRSDLQGCARALRTCSTHDAKRDDRAFMRQVDESAVLNQAPETRPEG